mgnify:CR=1 FL=1
MMRKLVALVLASLMVLTLATTAMAEHGTIIVKGVGPAAQVK